MNILVACEYSGKVRDAFRALGHYAWSCDTLPSDADNQYHFQCDVRKILQLPFVKWDILIAFPPCTHLCSSGARWFKNKAQEQADALDFVRLLMSQPIEYIAIENPIGVISSQIRKPDQIIQPWQFGHGETKATCLWLKNLPKLTPTDVVAGRESRIHRAAPCPNRWKERSTTYDGIAKAMASQWNM